MNMNLYVSIARKQQHQENNQVREGANEQTDRPDWLMSGTVQFEINFLFLNQFEFGRYTFSSLKLNEMFQPKKPRQDRKVGNCSGPNLKNRRIWHFFTKQNSQILKCPNWSQIFKNFQQFEQVHKNIF